MLGVADSFVANKLCVLIIPLECIYIQIFFTPSVHIIGAYYEAVR